MGYLAFEVNNQRELYLVQEKFDGVVRLKTYDGDEVESVVDIDPGDFVMLLNHYHNCKETGHPIVLDNYDQESEEDWFGKVRWCNDDIVAALQKKHIKPTDENVSLVRRQLEHHIFRDVQIERGWGHIDWVIEDLELGDETEPLTTYRVYFNGNDVTEVDAGCEDEAVELAKIIAAESGVEFELDEVECLGVLV